MFPAFFGKATRDGAPVAGMVVMGILQTVLALSTISPTMNEQFTALVNLAVVTNVVPYLIALSAVPLMMRMAGVAQAKYQRTVMVIAVALLYSVYAVYASGKDAVFGGMLVMGTGYAVWGFIAARFAPPKRSAIAA
jgi:putrescine:ornithine antiporter